LTSIFKSDLLSNMWQSSVEIRSVTCVRTMAIKKIRNLQKAGKTSHVISAVFGQSSSGVSYPSWLKNHFLFTYSAFPSEDIRASVMISS